MGWRQSSAFKKAFSVDVDIELIGVWLVALEYPISDFVIRAKKDQGDCGLCWFHPQAPTVYHIQYSREELPTRARAGRAPRPL